MDEAAAWNAAAGFLTSLQLEKGLADNTRLAYQRDLGDLIEYCKRRGLKGLDELTTADISRYLGELYDIGIAPATINRRLSAFRGFFTYLVREGRCQADPARLVTGPRPRRRLPNVLTIAEMERLLQQPAINAPAGVRDRAMLELMYACGLRVSELVTLRLGDLRLGGKMLLVKGKGGRQRLVPVGGYARDALARYLNEVRPRLVRDRSRTADALFLTFKLGRPMTRQGFWKILRGYVVAAGIRGRVTPHTLRHTFATHMLEGGAGLRDVQELLGHASLETTMIYTEVDREHLLEVVRSCHPRN